MYKKPEYQRARINIDRLRSISTQFNLTISKDKGGAAKDENEALRMRQIFVWSAGMTITPGLGYLSPIFPDRFWFMNDPCNLPVKDSSWEKSEKKAAWFTLKRAWKTLAKRERGDFKAMLQICLLLSHGISRLHRMGLAHSDISSNNVLVDPLIDRNGTGWPGCLIIDLDTIVVPGFYPAAVLGTRGYIAPEVLATSKLSNTKGKKMPSIGTDKHALAVLIYELLFNRHPLDGPKMRSEESEEEDEFLSFGQDAIFIEDPMDTSNRPKNTGIPYSNLGKPLAQCIESAFIAGLHNPYKRPLASDWERSLWKSLDLLHPCSNTTCLWRWFVCEDGPKSTCPWCGSHPPDSVPELHFFNQKNLPDRNTGKLVCWHGRYLHTWHVEENIMPLPFEDKQSVAEIIYDQTIKQWILKNHSIRGLSILSPSKKDIPKGGKELLLNGVILRLGDLSTSRIAKIHFNNGE
ncbi:MAG: hypothetical protein HN704_17895 [Bacteroidetes bacterium]|nr:hypothetical protein [Bacteroidota bacterium]MBT7493474.1 hypothetical protein [Bacteroidota bacterium]